MTEQDKLTLEEFWKCDLPTFPLNQRLGLASVNSISALQRASMTQGILPRAGLAMQGYR